MLAVRTACRKSLRKVRASMAGVEIGVGAGRDKRLLPTGLRGGTWLVVPGPSFFKRLLAGDVRGVSMKLRDRCGLAGRSFYEG